MDPNTFPTKGNLIAAKNSLKLATRGYGLMDKKRNILILLGALEAVMLQNHVKIATGEGVAAAMEVYKNAEK